MKFVINTFLYLDEDTQSFKTVSFKFHRLFNMPPEEKLVNYYSCRYVSNV
jgi:hypothetical protein